MKARSKNEYKDRADGRSEKTGQFQPLESKRE